MYCLNWPSVTSVFAHLESLERHAVMRSFIFTYDTIQAQGRLTKGGALLVVFDHCVRYLATAHRETAGRDSDHRDANIIGGFTRLPKGAARLKISADTTRQARAAACTPRVWGMK